MLVTSDRAVEYAIHYASVNPLSVDGVLAGLVAGRPSMYVVDANVARLYEPDLRTATESSATLGVLVMAWSERRKSLASAIQIWEFAHRVGLPRHGVIVVVGGGIALDVAGFAASAYRRGVDYVRIPTTLVACIDASLGIKCAVNFEGSKNLLGSFYPPVATIVSPYFLETLDRAAIRNGLAELLKLAVVTDEGLLESIERFGSEFVEDGTIQPESLDAFLGLGLRETTRLLSQDLFERQYERALDLGHTWSGLIEARSRFRIAHGQAVAADLIFTIALGVEMALTPEPLYHRVAELSRRMGIGRATRLMDSVLVVEGIGTATAHRGGRLRLPVPTAQGRVSYVNSITQQQIDGALRRLVS